MEDMRKRSLHLHIVLIVVLSLVPSIAFLTYERFSDREDALDTAVRAQEIAGAFASGAQSRVFESGKTLLQAVVQVPSVANLDPTPCAAFLAELQAKSSRYTAFLVSDLEGTVRCSSVPLVGHPNVADRHWFRRALEIGDFIIADYGRDTDPITGKESAGFALPIRGPGDQAVGVLYAGLDSGWMNDFLNAAKLLPDTTFTILDQRGAILAQYPNDGRVGTTLSRSALSDRILTQPPGESFAAIGADGLERIFHVFELFAAPDGIAVRAVIGTSVAALTAGADQRLAWSFLAIGMAALLLSFGAYVYGARFISRPFGRLVELSRRIAGGELEARSGLKYEAGEIGGLAESLDLMAAAIERNEKSLRESEARLRSFMDNAPVGMFVKDLEGRFVLVNENCAASFGGRPEAVLGRTMADFLVLEDLALVEEHDRQVLKTGQPVAREFHYVDRPAMEWSFTVKFPLHDVDGRVTGIGGIVVDITDRKKAEAELDRSRQFLEAVVNSLEDGISACNEQGRIIYRNPPLQKLYGQAPDHLAPDEWAAHFNVFHKDGKTPLRTEEMPLIRALNGEHVRDVELIIAPKGRPRRRFIVNARAMTDAEGHRLGAVATTHDITERREAEEARRIGEEKFRRLVESTDVIPYTWDFDTRRFTYIGPQTEKLLGYSRERCGTEGFWSSIVHPDDKTDYISWVASMAAGAARPNHEYRVLADDGRTVWIRDVLSRATTPEEREVGYGFILDITEAKSRERQLSEAQKMEAVGQLTGGVAHDFNNLLTVILGNLELIERSVEGDPRARKRIEIAASAAMRGAQLTRQLLAFSRRQVLEPKVVDLSELVSGVMALLRGALGELVEIKTVLAADLWPTKIDPAQLESALLNLAINSRDAMPGGGRLIIETSNQVLSESYAASHAEVRPGMYVMLAVSDTGAGMSPDVLQHAFEPFFTTKEIGKGTGLGLSMVYGFVKQSGGHIKIYSEQGHGTTIKLYFPRTETAASVPVDATGHHETQFHGKETILVVEDEEFVRGTAVGLLEELGYRVIEAHDGPSALARLEANPGVHLLFTDVVMPGGMNGVALARKVVERWPTIKVLYTSGYTENAIVHGGKLDEGVDWIGKPYFKADLARKIREVLEVSREARGEKKSP